jgi:hypothetical protein
MKITKPLTAGIAALALAAPAGAAIAALTAAPAQAVCSDQTPFDCQDQPGQGFICGGQQCGPPVDSSLLPPRIGPDGGQNWGRGLPCSTDPRFSGCPGYTADQTSWPP